MVNNRKLYIGTSVHVFKLFSLIINIGTKYVIVFIHEKLRLVYHWLVKRCHNIEVSF